MTNALEFLADNKGKILLLASAFGIFTLLNAALEAAKGLE